MTPPLFQRTKRTIVVENKLYLFPIDITQHLNIMDKRFDTNYLESIVNEEYCDKIGDYYGKSIVRFLDEFSTHEQLRVLHWITRDWKRVSVMNFVRAAEQHLPHSGNQALDLLLFSLGDKVINKGGH